MDWRYKSVVESPMYLKKNPEYLKKKKLKFIKFSLLDFVSVHWPCTCPQRKHAGSLFHILLFLISEPLLDSCVLWTSLR